MKLMSPKGTRTPLDLWWLAVLVILAATLVLDWSTSTSLAVSAAAAAILGAGHMIVVRGRRRARPSRASDPRQGA